MGGVLGALKLPGRPKLPVPLQVVFNLVVHSLHNVNSAIISGGNWICAIDSVNFFLIEQYFSTWGTIIQN